MAGGGDRQAKQGEGAMGPCGRPVRASSSRLAGCANRLIATDATTRGCPVAGRRPWFRICSGSGQRSSDGVNERTGMALGVLALKPVAMVGRGPIGKTAGELGIGDGALQFRPLAAMDLETQLRDRSSADQSSPWLSSR